MPSAADCFNVLANWFMYMFNRVGLKVHPYLTPRLCGKKSVCLYLNCTFVVLLFVSPLPVWRRVPPTLCNLEGIQLDHPLKDKNVCIPDFLDEV